MTAATLPVRLFREILLWPLAFDVGDDGKGMAGLAAQLRGTQWKEVEDPRRHLREDGTDDPLPREAYAEVVYFHPFVQRFLFADPTTEDRESRPMRLFQRTDVTRVRLTWGGSEPKIFALTVDRVNLYLFDSGIVILVVEISTTDGRAVLDVEPSLTLDPSFSRDMRSLTVADVQNILCRFRRAYPPFWNRNNPGYCFQSVEWLCGSAPLPGPGPEEAGALSARLNNSGEPPTLPHWRVLLSPLRLRAYCPRGTPEHAAALRHVVDDRIPTMALVGVNDPFAIDRGNQMRLCFADEPGNNELPYAHDFLEDFESKHAYDRFWEKGHCEHTTRYLCSGYNFVVLAKDGGPKAWSFLRAHLQTHFRRHYFQIGLLCHHQKAALLTLSDAVSGAVNDFAADLTAAPDDPQPRDALRKAMERLHGRALAFTHRFWFTDITNQIQGQELTALWNRQLGTQAVFDQLNREITESTAYLSARSQDRSTRSQDRSTHAALRLNYLAAAGLVLALTTGALGMNVLASGKWNQVGDWFELLGTFAYFAILISLCFFFLNTEGRKRTLFGTLTAFYVAGSLAAGLVWSAVNPPPDRTIGDRLRAAVQEVVR